MKPLRKGRYSGSSLHENCPDAKCCPVCFQCANHSNRRLNCRHCYPRRKRTEQHFDQGRRRWGPTEIQYGPCECTDTQRATVSTLSNAFRAPMFDLDRGGQVVDLRHVDALVKRYVQPDTDGLPAAHTLVPQDEGVVDVHAL